MENLQLNMLSTFVLERLINFSSQLQRERMANMKITVIVLVAALLGEYNNFLCLNEC